MFESDDDGRGERQPGEGQGVNSVSEEDELQGPGLLAKALALAWLHPHMRALAPFAAIAEAHRDHDPEARICDCDGLVEAFERITQAYEAYTSKENVRAKGSEHMTFEECLGFPRTKRGARRPDKQFELAMRAVDIVERFKELEEEKGPGNKSLIIEMCADEFALSEDQIKAIVRDLKRAPLMVEVGAGQIISR